MAPHTFLYAGGSNIGLLYAGGPDQSDELSHGRALAAGVPEVRSRREARAGHLQGPQVALNDVPALGALAAGL